ncbi:PREDICTED: membrane transport protein XK-like, partial [Odobenus rosmarus divergens]|uniref:XK-related protein n=1 Tax=Odobenus rosmarus divergens TaxID=9708 RepID=A0A9B0GUS0_ODORO
MKFPGSVLASVFLFVAETTAALYLSSTYRSGGDGMWQALTLLFSLLPCALVQLTLLFVHRDFSRDRPLVLLLHLLQLGPLFRCFEVFCIYCQSGHIEEPYVSITKKRQMPKNGFSEEVEKEVGQAEGKLFTHRSAFSRASVIQAFLGSAPQLTLQLYISTLQQDVTIGRFLKTEDGNAVTQLLIWPGSVDLPKYLTPIMGSPITMKFKGDSPKEQASLIYAQHWGLDEAVGSGTRASPLPGLGHGFHLRVGVILKEAAQVLVVAQGPLHLFWGAVHFVVVRGLLACQLQDVGHQ